MSDTSAAKANSANTQQFLTAFVTNTALLIVELGAFVFLKQHVKRVYSPRTYLPPPDKRSNELPSGPFKWVWTLFTTPTEEIIHKNGLDSYMYLRYLRLLIWNFLFYSIATWAVLLPVDSAGLPGSKSAGIRQFDWNNIPENQTNRYAAHLILVYIMTFFTLWLIRRESLHFVTLRQQFLVSPSHSRLAQARTVLITSVPDELTSDEKALRKWASFVPGGVGKVWIYKDSKDLNKEYHRRIDACNKLEKASSKLLRSATKTWRSQQKAEKKTFDRNCKAEHKAQSKDKDLEKNPTAEHSEKGEDEEYQFQKPPPTKESLLSLVPLEKWPTHRLGKIPFIGEKVNTIEWCKREIATLNADIPILRKSLGSGKPLGSVFIECNLQVGAHILAQVVSYHVPLEMTDKWVDVNAKDIIWDNLDDGAYEVRSRYVISWVLTFALIILWALPVAFVGLVSNLSQLCAKVPWLAWVCKAPTPVPGILEGLLPPILLAVLFILLPIALRFLAVYECIPRNSLVDISLYKRYYIFLFIHGFLVVTLSSGLTATIPQILDNPKSVVEDLATNLPRSSTFFLTYMVTQGFAGAGTALLQIAPLIMHFIKKKFFGQTPRQAFQVTFLMPFAKFGLILPRMSLLATIALAYSVLSPIINALALVVYSLYFIAWKFLFLYVFDQPEEYETGGFYFPLAISNLFTGLYVEQFCLAVLFILKATSGSGHLGFFAEGILMVVLGLVTLAFHTLINKAVEPVTQYLPVSLANKRLQERYLHRKKHHENKEGAESYEQENGNEEEEEDLFSRNRIQSVLRRKVKKIETTVKEDLSKLKAPAISKESDDTNIAKASGSNMNGAPAVPLDAMATLERQASVRTTSSKSSKSKKSEPAIAPAASRLRDDSDSEDEDELLEEHAFDHPSTYSDAPWIWLPHDELGFSTILLKELKEGDEGEPGIDASDLGATMDDKGAVECSRNPPDEDWSGGLDK